MKPPAKKKRAARFPLKLPLESRWRESGTEMVRPGTTENMSSTGVYFLSEQAPAIGTRSQLSVRLPFKSPSGQDTVVQCEGQVLRVEPRPQNRVGVAFHIEQYFLGGNSMPQQRRSPRMLWRAPVAAMWTDRDGANCQAVGESEVVNAHGGLIRLPTQTAPHDRAEVMHMRTREIRAARIVWQEALDGGREVRVGLELAEPSENFWGVRVPLGQRKS